MTRWAILVLRSMVVMRNDMALPNGLCFLQLCRDSQRRVGPSCQNETRKYQEITKTISQFYEARLGDLARLLSRIEGYMARPGVRTFRPNLWLRNGAHILPFDFVT